MADPVVLIGGGGHCKACIEVIESSGSIVAGIVDKDPSSLIQGYRFLGNDEELEKLTEGHSFLISIGFVKDPALRIRLFEKIEALGGSMATIVSIHAIVSKQSALGKGTIVMHQALVNRDAVIGNNCILNNKSLVEHDSVIGDHSHVSTAAIINGGCVVGKSVFIGSNAVLAQGVQVADNVVIGAGSVVIKNIVEPGIYAGNPAKRIIHEK